MCLQDSEAADACLKTFNPKLLGQGAIINKGVIVVKGLKMMTKRHAKLPQPQKRKDTDDTFDSDFDE